MWIQRDLAANLPTLAREAPVLLLTGARQTGKTTLLTRAWPDAEFVSLDLPAVAEEASETGNTFLNRFGRPLIIDEVQYAPKLFRYLKEAVDRDRQRYGAFLLTGSQRFQLMESVSDSLAGRVAIVECHPLAAREIERHTGQKIEGTTLANLIFRGGYPEVWAQNLAPDRFYANYVATYLERDVRTLLQVRSLGEFERFLRLSATRTGQLVSHATLAADLGLSPTTVKSWLNVLEASQIVRLIEPFYENLGKRIIKTPKLYFLDTGLASFLAGFRSAAELQRSTLMGAFFETHVMNQILRTAANRAASVPIYFFRDAHGLEVDFVIARGTRLILLECKWSENPSRTTANLETVANIASSLGRQAERVIVCASRESVPSSDNRAARQDSVDWDWIF